MFRDGWLSFVLPEKYLRTKKGEEGQEGPEWRQQLEEGKARKGWDSVCPGLLPGCPTPHFSLPVLFDPRKPEGEGGQVEGVFL